MTAKQVKILDDKVALVRMKIKDFKIRRKLIDDKITEYENYINGLNYNITE